jgi:hypothetical protein
MLPLECHYVAEIRYQEHVHAARPPRRDRGLAVNWLPQLALGPALVALRQGWLKLTGRPIELPVQASCLRPMCGSAAWTSTKANTRLGT